MRTTADPQNYSRAALAGVIAAREAWGDAGLSIAEPNAVAHGSAARNRRRRTAHYDFFMEREARDATPSRYPSSGWSRADPISLRLHGVKAVFVVCTSRPMIGCSGRS